MYEFDYKSIYANARKPDGQYYKNQSESLKNIFWSIKDGSDFNDVDDISNQIFEDSKQHSRVRPVGFSDKTMGEKMSLLATFIKILPETDLKKLRITDREKLVKNLSGKYWKKVNLYHKQYKENRAQGILTASQEEKRISISDYKTFVEKCRSELFTLLNNVVMTTEDKELFMRLAVVVWLHDMPNIRSAIYSLHVGFHHAEINYLIESVYTGELILVYNKHKVASRYGTLIHIVDENEDKDMYTIILKLAQLSREDKHGSLWWDYEQDLPFSVERFRKFISAAHDPIGIGLSILRILDESEQLTNISKPLRSLQKDAARRGHTFTEALLYKKDL